MRTTIVLLLLSLSVPITLSGTAVAQGYPRGSLSGFKDPAGNIWLQDRRGRSGVILNMDDPEPEQQVSRKPDFKFMEPDSSGLVKLR